MLKWWYSIHNVVMRPMLFLLMAHTGFIACSYLYMDPKFFYGSVLFVVLGHGVAVYRYSPALSVRTGYVLAFALAYASWHIGDTAQAFSLLVVGLVIYPFAGSRLGSDIAGSAQWQGYWGMGKSGLFGSRGLMLGKIRKHYIRYFGEAHVLTCASTGAGKGIGAVLPNLVTYPGSVFVNDIKGENYQITAKRRQAMGHDVLLFDPFSVTGDDSFSINWLDILDEKSPDFVANAQVLADVLVERNPDKSDQHWDNAASTILKGIILYVACHKSDRDIIKVRELITLSKTRFKRVLKDMQASNKAGGIISKTANMILQKGDKELSAVMSTLHHHTDFLDTPSIQKVLRPGKKHANIHDILHKKLSIYLVIPPDKVGSYSAFIRGMILAYFNVLSQKTRKLKGDERILFFIDEFAQLGYMAPIETAISLMRGYGITLWLLIQDLSQLKAVYPKWESFIANARVLQFFGTNDMFTAKYISEYLGKTTCEYGDHDTPKQRPLLFPDEVMHLPQESEILILPDMLPIMARKINILNEPYLRFLCGPSGKFLE